MRTTAAALVLGVALVAGCSSGDGDDAVAPQPTTEEATESTVTESTVTASTPAVATPTDTMPTETTPTETTPTETTPTDTTPTDTTPTDTTPTDTTPTDTTPTDTTPTDTTPTLDAAGFVNAFQDADLPIGDFVVWDEDTDPNELLGRPGQYVGKATWVDDRAEPCFDGEPNWECGGDVEVFANDSDRDARFEYLSGFATESFIGGFYMWKADNAIVRVGYALTPSAAATYETALRNTVTVVEALDSDIQS